jgi:SAM-dependent methyltransferase
MQPKWVAELSEDFEHDESVVDEAILAHLQPARPPDVLFERLYALGLGAGDLVVDVGCGEGRQALTIASAVGCRVLALDPSRQFTAIARELTRASGSEHVHLVCAAAEALPVGDGSAAAIWCRDMLYYVDLPHTMREFARALQPNGHAIVYHTFATELMEPFEAQRLYSPAFVQENMVPAHFESCARDAGFAIVERDIIGSEWREALETGDGPRTASQKLLRAARMLRGGESLRRAIGEKLYNDHLSDSLWGIYQMLGKLRPTIYVLQRE